MLVLKGFLKGPLRDSLRVLVLKGSLKGFLRDSIRELYTVDLKGFLKGPFGVPQGCLSTRVPLSDP